jgi:hypothetical protein
MVEQTAETGGYKHTHTYIAVAFIRTLQNRVRFKKPIEKETHKSHFT